MVGGKEDGRPVGEICVISRLSLTLLCIDEILFGELGNDGDENFCHYSLTSRTCFQLPVRSSVLQLCFLVCRNNITIRKGDTSNAKRRATLSVYPALFPILYVDRYGWLCFDDQRLD